MYKASYVVIPLLTILVAIIGGWFTSAGLESWYDLLIQPDIAPPNYVFGPVWTSIYILATISVIIVWEKAKLSWRYETIIGLFIANALLNILWSFLFFYLHLLGWALLEMIVLNLTTLALIILIWPISRVASLLLTPYLVWVSFATYLAYLIMVLN